MLLTFSLKFNTVAERLRADYPGETRDMTIVDISTPQGHRTVMDWYLGAHRDFREFTFGDASPSEKRVREYLAKAPLAFAVRDPKTGLSLLAARHAYSTSAFHAHPLTEALTIAAHEAGHLVPAQGLPLWRETLNNNFTQDDKDVQEHASETVSDLFAAASGLRLGFLKGAAHIRNMSLRRAIDAWCTADVSYATSRALDQMSVTDEETALIASLRPPQIKSFAEVRRAKHGFSEKALYAGIRDFRAMAGRNRLDSGPAETQAERDGWLLNVAHTAYEASPESVTGYLAEKILGHVLKTGHLPHPEPRMFDVHGRVWDNARKMLAARKLKNR